MRVGTNTKRRGYKQRKPDQWTANMASHEFHQEIRAAIEHERQARAAFNAYRALVLKEIFSIVLRPVVDEIVSQLTKGKA